MHSQSSPVRCALTDVIVVTHHQHTAGMELKVSSHGRNSFSCLPSTKVQFTCEPSPGADVAAASPVPAQMWQRGRTSKLISTKPILRMRVERTKGLLDSCSTPGAIISVK